MSSNHDQNAGTGEAKKRATYGRRSRRERIRDRDVEAARLRTLVYSYRAIAEKVGYADGSGAHRAVQRIVDLNATEPVEEARTLELSRLDELHRESWHLMRTADGMTKLRAIDRLLAIAERRTKLLGMDAPTKHERWVHNADTTAVTASDLDKEIERLTTELSALDDTTAVRRGISDPEELEVARLAVLAEEKLGQDVERLGGAAVDRPDRAPGE